MSTWVFWDFDIPDVVVSVFRKYVVMHNSYGIKSIIRIKNIFWVNIFVKSLMRVNKFKHFLNK